MVQSFYSLEEAAGRLGMSEDDLKRMVQTNEIRAFADGGSFKFRQQDIDELARARQHGTDPELRLGEIAPQQDDEQGGDIMDEDSQVVLDGMASGVIRLDDEDDEKTIVGVKGSSDSDVRLVLREEESQSASDSDVALVSDDVQSDSDSGSQSESGDHSMVNLGEEKTHRAPTDSDVRMTFDDSVPNAPKPKEFEKAQQEGFGERTEEITLREEDFDLPADGAQADSGLSDSGTIGEDFDSDQARSDDDLDFKFDEDMSQSFTLEGTTEFDLAGFDSDDDTGSPHSGPTGSDIVPLDSVEMQSDSGSGIKLTGSDSDITAGGPDSGINLDRPNDSGISLESADDSTDSEFELSLDSDAEADIFGTDEMPAFKDDEDEGASGVLQKGKSPTAADDDTTTAEVSDSDFELAIDDDFDEDESGSEVVAIDEDEDDEIEAELDEEVEEAYEDEDEYDDYDDVAAAAAPMQRGAAQAAAAANPPWPGWLTAPLIITALVLVCTGLMMVELMRNAWAHQTPYGMNATIIEGVASLAKSIGL